MKKKQKEPKCPHCQGYGVTLIPTKDKDWFQLGDECDHCSGTGVEKIGSESDAP